MLDKLKVEFEGEWGDVMGAWLDSERGKAIMDEAAEVAVAGGLEDAYFPEWVINVPEERQREAVLAYTEGLIKKKVRADQVKVERDLKKQMNIKEHEAVIARRKEVIQKLDEKHFVVEHGSVEVMVEGMPGYMLSFAYRIDDTLWEDLEKKDRAVSSGEIGEFSDVRVYLSICAPGDLDGWTYDGARERLLERIEAKDETHSFVTMVERSMVDNEVVLRNILLSRILERVYSGHKGFPHIWRKSRDLCAVLGAFYVNADNFCEA